MAITFKKGERINFLTILDDTYSYSKGDVNGGNIRRYWRCQCDCGKEVYIAASSLKRGTTKSCGCYNKQRTIEASRINEIGNKYGKLTVVEYAYTKNNRAYWNCQCECGNVVAIQGPHLRAGNTISCGQCARVSLGEIKIKEILTNLNVPFSQEVRFSTCRDKQPLPFDFAIYNGNQIAALIEFQGKQYYESTGGWSTPEHLETIRRHDKIKSDWANAHNISLYIIPYTKFNNLEEIIQGIVKVKAEVPDMEKAQEVIE